jgi:hypothetical protein
LSILDFRLDDRARSLHPVVRRTHLLDRPGEGIQHDEPGNEKETENRV